MTGHRLILAVDIGTSGARAVLFDERADHLLQTRKPYATMFPQQGWSEQDPNVVVEAVVEALKEAVACIRPDDLLAGIVFSSQMYSIVALDGAGAPLSNSLTWGDTRSAGLALGVRQSASRDLALNTGCPTQAIYPLAKILWLKANLSLSADDRFVSIKDYVIFRLTSQLVTDWSTASASGLLNITTHRWDDEALAICGITSANLPELVSPRHILRSWRQDIAEVIGIPMDTPLIMGAGDAPLANIGVGATGPGALAVNIGTSAAARVLTKEPQADPSSRLWTYVADIDRWVIGGIIGSGGAVYEWLLKKLLFDGRDIPLEALFQEANRLAETVSPGSDGLLFIPYMSGEQSPGWNPESKGLIYGMTFQHEPRHYIRAAVEGICFALLRAAKPINDLHNTRAETIYLTGGLTASSVWPRTLSNVFGMAVVVPRSSESSARGAAIMGWLALGAANRYEDFAQPEHLVYPDDEFFSLYQRHFKAFCSLNHHLQNALRQ